MINNRRYDDVDVDSKEYKSIEQLTAEYYERCAVMRAEAKVLYDRFFSQMDEDLDQLERNMNRM